MFRLQIFMCIKDIVKIIIVSIANHTLSHLKWLTDMETIMLTLYVILIERPFFLAFQTFMWKCALSIGVILVVELKVGDKKHL